MFYMTGDASIARDAFPVNAPGLAPSGSCSPNLLVFLSCCSYGFVTLLVGPWVYYYLQQSVVGCRIHFGQVCRFPLV